MTTQSLPEHVTIIEVGPRDGLQNEATIISTDTKVELIERLANAGIKHVESTSFVNPKLVPQLADASQVMSQISRLDGVTYPVLVPNERGYDAALSCGATSISIFTAASESFTQRNINTTIEDSIKRFASIVKRAAHDGIHVRGYVSTAWGCPFEGEISVTKVQRVVQQLADIGVIDISLGDTIGVATPREIELVMEPLMEFDSDLQFSLHLHDTRGMAIANAWTGLQLGITKFDTSVAGLGGCPFAPDSSGNLATEDLVWMLERCGIHTGIDLLSLIEIARWISSKLNHSISGHIAGSRLWPWQPSAID